MASDTTRLTRWKTKHAQKSTIECTVSCALANPSAAMTSCSWTNNNNKNRAAELAKFFCANSGEWLAMQAEVLLALRGFGTFRHGSSRLVEGQPYRQATS